jgi:hypothetical protein
MAAIAALMDLLSTRTLLILMENMDELLQRIGGFGNDGRWLGSRWSASLLLEGVSVARR